MYVNKKVWEEFQRLGLEQKVRIKASLRALLLREMKKLRG
jgi:hypothetical protein